MQLRFSFIPEVKQHIKLFYIILPCGSFDSFSLLNSHLKYNCQMKTNFSIWSLSSTFEKDSQNFYTSEILTLYENEEFIFHFPLTSTL